MPEYPRTVHELHVERPDGSTVRFAGDEPKAPMSDYAFYTALPGGQTTADASILNITGERVPKHSRARLFTADGRQVWQGRVEATNEETDGDTHRLTLRGDEALLDDAAHVTFLGCDQSLDGWRDPPRKRRKAQHDAGRSLNSAFQASVNEEGLSIAMDPDRTIQSTAAGELWYGEGHEIAEVQYIASESLSANMLPTVASFVAPDDSSTDSFALTTSLAVTSHTFSDGVYYLRFRDTPDATTVNKASRILQVHAVTVYGDHDLPLYDISGLPQGMKFSDILTHLVEQFQPLLNTEIEESSFITPDAKWLEPVTLRQVLEDAEAYEFNRAWGVWGGTLEWGRRREMGHTWTLRRSEGAEFIDSGEAGEPDYNGVLVTYESPNGQTKWAGPPGSGADTEDDSLYDSDPSNPVNASRVVGDRFFTVEAQGLNADKAVELGAEILSDLLTSRFVGEVKVPPYALRDGVWQPTSLMDARDWIEDAERGVRMPLSATAYRPSEKPMTATIDLPARRLDALIARQGAKARKVNRRDIRRRLRRGRKRRRRERNRR